MKYTASGTIVNIRMMMMEFTAVTLILSIQLAKRILSVTMTIERAKDSKILSIIFKRLKKTNDQANPGKKHEDNVYTIL